MSFPRAITYIPGSLTAIVGDGVALLVEADPAGLLVAACRDALAQDRGVDAVLSALTESRAVTFALAAAAVDGLRLVVGGRAQAEFAGGVAATVSAAGLPYWLDQHLDTAPDLRLSLADPAARIDPSWPLLPIDAGVVLAAALIIPAVTSDAPPAVDPDSDTGQVPVAEPAGAPDAALPWRGATRSAPDSDDELPPPSTEPTVSAPLLPAYAPVPAYAAPAASGPPAGSDDAPMVQAVICANNHLNAPFVVGACRVCGSPVPAQAPFLAPRPTLGVLVLPSGETVPVDRDVLLGRAPFSVDGDDRHSPRIVTLPSPSNDLSRTHVRVSIDGWLVQVTDLGSTNGTVATMPGQQGVRLRAHDPFVLVPGTVVNLADEAVVRFEVPA